MYCRNCRAEIKPGLSFCTNCGTKVIEEHSETMTQVIDQTPIKQPAQAAPTCPVCGHLLEQGDAFCTNCGAHIDGGAQRAAVAPAVVPTGNQMAAVNPLPARQGGIKREVPILAIAGVSVLAGLMLACGLFLLLGHGSIADLFRGSGGNGSPEALQPKEEQPEDEQPEEQPEDLEIQKSTPAAYDSSTLPRRWKGTYEGASKQRTSGTIVRSIEFNLDKVDDDGKLSGVCRIGIADTGVGATNASYHVEGSIDWHTGELELHGTRWIDSGELARMLRYSGEVDAETGTITGSSYELTGERIGPWSMTAVQ